MIAPPALIQHRWHSTRAHQNHLTSSDEAFEQPADVGDDDVQVQQLRLDDLLAAEGQQLAREPRRPRARL